ncbi:MAG TPA: SRPBCC family protein [Thermoanaerobaculia bacterium]|nr:SRPBCC family protein [Thermoanaerobaculia bacterium]
MTNTDRIEKQILLRAPKSRVWRALTDAGEFGAWFRVKLEGRFAVGQRIRGQMTYPGYEHVTMDVTVERMDAEKLFSFRWHPGAVDPKVDYSKEPTTLIEFRLEEVESGTRLTVIESGFDQLPPERREEAFRGNERGWSIQMENIKRHVDG